MSPASAPRSQSGFTLVEMVVVMALGMAVSMATFAIIDTALHSQKRTSDRASATARGRTAVESLLQYLHSGCVVNQVGPLLSGPVTFTDNDGNGHTVSSDAWNVVFVSGLGSGLTPLVTEHVVWLSNGKLTDSQFAQTGGAAPNWTFSATATTQRTLLTNVSSAYSPTGGQPIFTYYSYSNPSNPRANSLVGAAPVSVPLSANPTDANAAASVAQLNLALAAGPSSGATSPATNYMTVNDGVVFRFSAASEGTASVNTPCA